MLKKNYMVRFFPTFLVIFFGTVLFGTFIVLFPFDYNIAAIVNKCLYVIIFSSLWALFFNSLMIYFYEVTVDESGLRCANCWGVFGFIEWQEIDRCHEIKFLGLSHLRIYSKKMTFPLWLPLYLKNEKEFKKDVLQVCSKGNCLREFFE